MDWEEEREKKKTTANKRLTERIQIKLRTGYKMKNKTGGWFFNSIEVIVNEFTRGILFRDI